MINRQQAPTILDAVSFTYNLQPIETVRFDNGSTLYWLNAGTQDVVQIEWLFEAGLWQEPATALAQAVAAQLKNGTLHRDAAAINNAIEFYGASLKVNASNDYTTITLHALTKHLPQLLPVIQEIVTEAAFPEEELRIYKQNARQRLEVSLRKAEFIANRHIDALLFGRQHPYGRFTEAEDLEPLQATALRNFHSRYYHAANCRMFMSGHIGAQEVALLQQYFGAEFWGNAAAEEVSIQHSKQPATDRHYRISNDENGVQGAIRIARPFPDRHHPDFTPMLLLNSIFGGYFGSRLMANIREDKGYTYGISSYIYTYKHESALMIATEAGRDVCEAAITEVYKEMDLLNKELVPEEELLLVKNYILGNLLGDLDGPFAIMQRWKNLILYGFDENRFYEQVTIYKTITAEKLQVLARQYLNKNDFYELVVV